MFSAKTSTPNQRFKKLVSAQDASLAVFRNTLATLNNLTSTISEHIFASEATIVEQQKVIEEERQAIEFLKAEQFRAAASAQKISALLGE